MKIKFLTRTFILLCVIVLNFQLIEAQKNTNNQQNQSNEPCDCPVEYEDVMTELFPQYFLGGGNAHTMFLSYTPPNEPETQINILFSKPEKPEVYLYKSIDKSILLQLQDIQEKNCNASYSEIIKQIKFRKTRINLTENESEKIRIGFFDAVKNSIIFENKIYERTDSNLVRIYGDLAGYKVKYDGAGRINLYGEGSSINNKSIEDEPPFIGWMKEIYKLVESKNR